MRPFWAPIAPRRLSERWNDVSGGWSRTGPPFREDGLDLASLSRPSQQKRSPSAPNTSWFRLSACKGRSSSSGASREQKSRPRVATVARYSCLPKQLAFACSRRERGRGRACASGALRTAASARAASLLDRTPQCSPAAPVAEARNHCTSARRCSERHAEPSRGSARRELGAPRRAEREDRMPGTRRAPRTRRRIAHPLAAAGIKRRR